MLNLWLTSFYSDTRHTGFNKITTFHCRFYIYIQRCTRNVYIHTEVYTQRIYLYHVYILHAEVTEPSEPQNPPSSWNLSLECRIKPVLRRIFRRMRFPGIRECLSDDFQRPTATTKSHLNWTTGTRSLANFCIYRACLAIHALGPVQENLVYAEWNWKFLIRFTEINHVQWH